MYPIHNNILENRLNDFKIKHIVAMRLTQFNTRANDVSVVTDLMIHDIDLANFFLKSSMKSVNQETVTCSITVTTFPVRLLTFANVLQLPCMRIESQKIPCGNLNYMVTTKCLP